MFIIYSFIIGWIFVIAYYCFAATLALFVALRDIVREVIGYDPAPRHDDSCGQRCYHR